MFHSIRQLCQITVYVGLLPASQNLAVLEMISSDLPWLEVALLCNNSYYLLIACLQSQQ